jgi:hypothetical protein
MRKVPSRTSFWFRFVVATLILGLVAGCAPKTVERPEAVKRLRRGPEQLQSQKTPERPGPARPPSVEEEEDRTRNPLPKSKSKRTVKTSDPTAPLTDRDDPPPGGRRMNFKTYVTSGSPTGATASDGAADVSGGDVQGGLALHTGNWYIDMVDAGTVKRFDPTSVFTTPLLGGFCCDQVVTYVGEIDRFVWYMQHNVDAGGTGGFRLAIAKPDDVRSNFQTAWTYWDVTAKYFGEDGRKFDYPDLAFTGRYLIGSSNVSGRGRIVFRTDLNTLAKGGSIGFDYTDPAQSPEANFQFSHLVQHARDTALWAGHSDTATIRVFNLPDSGNTYSFKDVGIANWPYNTYSSQGPDGNNWLDSPWIDREISGGTRKGNELWLAWTATAGKSPIGGFDFPKAHVRVVAINMSTWKTSSEMQVWNPDYAFGYPFLDTNSEGEVGIVIGWGGPGNNANTAEGIIGDFVVWYHNGSDVTPDRFGDYITLRRSGDRGNDFAAFGYYTVKDTTRPSGYLYTPYYSVFSH